METRGLSSNLEIFLFGKSPKAKEDYPGGQMVGVGMTSRFSAERFLNAAHLGPKAACEGTFFGTRSRSK